MVFIYHILLYIFLLQFALYQILFKVVNDLKILK